MSKQNIPNLAFYLALLLCAGPSIAADQLPSRQALFGDLHIHSANSFDSYTADVRATPDDAYRFAKGEAITHPELSPNDEWADFEIMRSKFADYFEAGLEITDLVFLRMILVLLREE